MRTSAPGQSALMMADIAWPLEARGVRYAVIGFADATLEIVGREGFIAMKAFAGGPVDLADVRVIIELDREALDLELLRRLAQRFGRDATRAIDQLISGAGIQIEIRSTF